MKTVRLVIFVIAVYLAPYGRGQQATQGSGAPEVLHPAIVHVMERPAAVQIDPAKRYPESSPTQVAILLTKADEAADSPVRCLQAMGIPFFVTHDLETALRHKLVILYPEVDGATFEPLQAQAIVDFVSHGGTLFAQNVFAGGLRTLFGFDEYGALRTRHKVVFDAGSIHDEPAFQYLNRPEEQWVPLGSANIKEVIWTNGYKASTQTRVLARFDDGTAAMLRHDVGRGHTYLIGVALNDVVLRNQQNRDYEAQRIYVNGFEPGTDVWLLILRAWYEAYADSGLRLGTIPNGKRSVLMLSHDVDWEYSFKPMLAFADFEQGVGISSTFFVQTKYIDDATSHAFFFGQSLDYLREVAKGKSDIESHTVIHTMLFNKVPLGTGLEQYPTYRGRATADNPAQDATALGEVCVSKSMIDGVLPGHTTVFFRAGHLRVPPYLPEALVRCGYEFDSSFTAPDVLSNFPYELDFDLGWTEPSGVFEFPVTFEDEQLPPLPDRVPSMVDTIEANAENGAASVILIHSNNALAKLDAERKLISLLPKDVLVESMIEYARFWKARTRIHWLTRPSLDGEEVEIQTELPISGLTLVSPQQIKNATGMAGIRYTDHEVILPDIGANSQARVQISLSPK